MAGRRLSSNDVSVVIALAIVVLVLLLIFLVERRAGRADESDAAAVIGPRAGAGVSAASPLAVAPSGDAPVASASASCADITVQLVPGQTEDGLAARQRDEAVQAILATLNANPEPRARAAGLYFRAARDRLEGRVGDLCKERPDECAASEQRQRDARGSAEALARLAVDSADPQVYAWAYRSCAAAARDTAGSCQLINALQWARLDPGNGEPWFAVAREARSRRDGAGVDDAMFHVAAASVHDAGWGRLVEEMVKAASQEDRMLVGTWLASADAMSYETLDLSLPDLSRYCDARALANANRRDTCEKIATVLVDRSTTLLGRSVGVALAKRLDWPPARLAAVDEESDATRAVESREALRRTEPPSCSDIRSDLARLVDVGRLGEVEALRRRVARTGEPIAALADEGRQLARRAEAAGAAREAASPASMAMAVDAAASAAAHGR
jgi:hypothetical protein